MLGRDHHGVDPHGPEERIELDIWYVDHWSPLLDLRILFRTPLALMNARGLYGPDGITISPNDPKNPLGGAWIGLTDRIGIHGAADPQSVGRDDNRGTICVGDRDLQDLYGILSVGSRVTIVR